MPAALVFPAVAVNNITAYFLAPAHDGEKIGDIETDTLSFLRHDPFGVKKLKSLFRCVVIQDV